MNQAAIYANQKNAGFPSRIEDNRLIIVKAKLRAVMRLPGLWGYPGIPLLANELCMKRFGLICGLLLAVAFGSTPTFAAVVCAPGKATGGLDVSLSNGTPTWKSVGGAGNWFVFTRISDGTKVDSSFDANHARIKATGIVLCGYQIFEPAQDPVAQANLCLAKIPEKGGSLPQPL
jgi:hypothetical protein